MMNIEAGNNGVILNPNPRWPFAHQFLHLLQLLWIAVRNWIRDLFHNCFDGIHGLWEGFLANIPDSETRINWWKNMNMGLNLIVFVGVIATVVVSSFTTGFKHITSFWSSLIFVEIIVDGLFSLDCFHTFCFYLFWFMGWLPKTLKHEGQWNRRVKGVMAIFDITIEVASRLLVHFEHPLWGLLFKLCRASRLHRIIAWYPRRENDRVFFYIMECFRWTITTASIIHVGACVIFALTIGVDAPELTWIGRATERGDFVMNGTMYCYRRAAYWSVASVTTTGYGDYRAHLDDELIFSIVLMIVSLIWFAGGMLIWNFREQVQGSQTAQAAQGSHIIQSVQADQGSHA